MTTAAFTARSSPEDRHRHREEGDETVGGFSASLYEGLTPPPPRLESVIITLGRSSLRSQAPEIGTNVITLRERDDANCCS